KETLCFRLQKSRLEAKTTILELQSEIKQKNYELDKLLEIHKETSLKLQDQQLENEKLTAKLEAINLELQLIQQKQTLSEQVLENKMIQLEQYKKLEKDLDEISEKINKDNVEDESVQSLAEKILIPSTLGKLQHNVNLFHKITELEKKISSLSQELSEEKKIKENLQKDAKLYV
ncbi:intracellular protein transport protein uso1-like, partial [Centruroides sculpturatus]|uniref:intracellular protein transport protein uso1-like n=1 Tax=Centruroides sculpturatus TaxID=218467 RepID=UPI000C6DECA5